jgi:hypothetical protein
LDDPDLALRLGHRCLCLFDALQMVPSGNVMPGNPARDRLARAAVSSPPLGRSGGRPSLKSTQTGLSASRCEVLRSAII